VSENHGEKWHYLGRCGPTLTLQYNLLIGGCELPGDSDGGAKIGEENQMTLITIRAASKKKIDFKLFYLSSVLLRINRGALGRQP